VAGTDDNAGTAVPPTAETVAPAAPKKRAARAAKADAKADAKPDPAALAAEIEKTREDLADTLDAIAEKVSPKRVAKRTTKKVTSAVKDTAHDAAAAVKDTATSAKDKVSGGQRSEQSWAPPAPKAPVAAASNTAPAADLKVEDATHPLPLPTTEPTEVPADVLREPARLASTASDAAPAKPWYAPPAAPPDISLSSSRPLVRPEYLAVGVVAGLAAWFLVRRRR
jgi:hypothetical protein